jgi:hypothetical protein
MGDRLMAYNGYSNYESWNVNLWVMNDEGYYEAWKVFKRHYGTFTAKNARATARGIFGGKTPDRVRLKKRCINWEEIANVWNEKE